MNIQNTERQADIRKPSKQADSLGQAVINVDMFSSVKECSIFFQNLIYHNILVLLRQ